VLALVLLALLLAYAYPVRVYLAQQAEIASMQTQQAAQQHKIDDLAEQRAKWDDPEYIKSQARRRLQYTLPGETPYVVIGGSPETSTQSDATTTQAQKVPPWYGKLWGSIAAADRR
jgi:cell division protein FtsB